MSEICYYKANPTGNITLLVTTPVPRSEQAALAARLMSMDKTAEQVGFIEKSDNCALRLQMMGGEFCGNATLSAAALAKLQGHDGDSVTLEVSGADKPLTVEIAQSGENEFSGAVDMPLPVSCFTALLRHGDFVCELPVVRFEGISHIIIGSEDVKKYGFDVKSAGEYIKSWCTQLCAEALGLMFLDEKEGLLNPFVYVCATDSSVWESSCASGSTAVAAYLSMTKGQRSVTLTQPGGTLSVETESRHGTITELKLRGSVSLSSPCNVNI